MANQVHKFKHRDVVRVVKAARAAGVDVDQVTVDPHTGEITVGARLPANGTTNPLDDWMANRADQTEGH
jgi:hypothetical protein